MSLICIGKLCHAAHDEHALRSYLSTVSAVAQIHVVVDRIDPDDIAELESEPELCGFGTFYGACSREEDSSLTQVWNEAFSVGHHDVWPDRPRPALHRQWSVYRSDFCLLDEARRNALLSTRLGTLLKQIIYCPFVTTGSLALLDGGIERVVRAPSAFCVEEILGMTVLGWDCIGNPLYIWSH